MEERQMRKLLVPLDGSARAAAVLPPAAAFARALGSELLLLQIVAAEGAARGRPAADPAAEEAQANARAYLERMAAAMRRSDLPIATATAVGHPATCIVQAVRHDPL